MYFYKWLLLLFVAQIYGKSNSMNLQVQTLKLYLLFMLNYKPVAVAFLYIGEEAVESPKEVGICMACLNWNVVKRNKHFISFSEMKVKIL